MILSPAQMASAFHLAPEYLCIVCSFPVGAVVDCHKLCGFTQQFILILSGSQRSEVISTELKSR